jgi:uncharacterized protein
MNIVLAGATGFLGTPLIRWLKNDGHRITVLTRTPRHPDEVRWDPYGSPANWVHVLKDADAVINLAGAPISKRWTAAHKREMRNSRIRSTRTLVAAMKSLPRMPATLINASAVGIYGARGEELITENSPPGSGFLASLARDWEQEALVAAPQTRVVLLRTAIALDTGGGALPLMALPFRFFVGGPIGSGRQYLSWIHRDDWVAMVTWALTARGIEGALNVASPHPVTWRCGSRWAKWPASSSPASVYFPKKPGPAGSCFTTPSWRALSARFTDARSDRAPAASRRSGPGVSRDQRQTRSASSRAAFRRTAGSRRGPGGRCCR